MIYCVRTDRQNTEKYVESISRSLPNSKLVSYKEAINSLITELIPISYVITPNVPEAEDLVSMKINSIKDMYNAADKIYKLTDQRISQIEKQKRIVRKK